MQVKVRSLFCHWAVNELCISRAKIDTDNPRKYCKWSQHHDNHEPPRKGAESTQP